MNSIQMLGDTFQQKWSLFKQNILCDKNKQIFPGRKLFMRNFQLNQKVQSSTVCPISSAPFYIVTYYLKWVCFTHDPFYIVTYYVKGVMTSWPLSIQGSHKEKFFFSCPAPKRGGGVRAWLHRKKNTFFISKKIPKKCGH